MRVTEESFLAGLLLLPVRWGASLVCTDEMTDSHLVRIAGRSPSHTSLEWLRVGFATRLGKLHRRQLPRWRQLTLKVERLSGLHH